MAIKFCTKCGKKFESVGREVICPDCKAQAAEESKKAAVLKAKAKSWTGESVPVRISGRASTVIRKYGAEKGLPFAAALDDLLKASTFFQSAGKAWNDITPYKSRRRDKTTSTTETAQEVKTASKPQDVQDTLKQEAKVTSKKSTASTNKKASSKPSKPSKPASVKKEG